MQTPIVDFVRQYAERSALRLHMPGHKGTGPLGAEALDLTEIEGADVLYHATGILRQSQENVARIFGTAKTLYSTEGSSLAIRAMLYLAVLFAKSMGKRPTILAARNAHKTFVTAAALLQIDVQWLMPSQEDTVLSCHITPSALEEQLLKSKPTAVYLTSPDYLGNVADIEALSQLCHKHGVLLLVDNAHGAYLRFVGRHPMQLGADLCCDSAHKTLPVLTGGAYLHIAKGAPGFFLEHADLAMSIFASTSPSYLILQSLDATNRYLSEGYEGRLAAFIAEAAQTKRRLSALGYRFLGEEPLKLTIATKSYGYTGDELAQHLTEQNIVCEFSDPDFLVLMLTPEVGEAGLERLETALASIEHRQPIAVLPPKLPNPVRVMPMYEALTRESRECPIVQCDGAVLAAPSVTCPPAVPILVCGERIDAQAIACMEYYGIEKCRIVV